MSAILSIDDLSDYITPGVACIKPIETLPAAPAPSDPSLEHEVVLDGQHPSTKTAAAPAQISLTDCLACSGCVTSAEAVLVSLQSHAEVLNVLDSAPALRILGPDVKGQYRVDGLEDESRRLYVASVSPQTRANLAAACGNGTTERQAGYMLERLLRGYEGLGGGGKWGNGFAWAVDTNVAREACLVLGADEVLGSNPRPGTTSKSILTSSCPGWVCYAEKTHPYVLPHLSKVKSPQALMGTLLKSTLSRKLGIPPSRIWHLAVMPCFDKKLEASREELTDAVWAGDGPSGHGIRDVDCVITSKEIFMLAESRGLDFFALSPTPMPAAQDMPFPDDTLRSFFFPHRNPRRSQLEAGSSGGNLYFVLQTVVSQHPGSRIDIARGRNADVVEYAVSSAQGELLFKAARYYGFRNIQNLVRKLKPAKVSRMPVGKLTGSARRPVGGKLEYAYVEVMACPGGCTNGGGQLKLDDRVIMDRRGLTAQPDLYEQKQWLGEIDEAYFSADERDERFQAAALPEDLVDGVSPSYIRDTLAYWSRLVEVELDQLVFTTYREVVSDVGKDKLTDTERVVQLASKSGGGW